jgi:hypothetical protein
MNSGTKLSNYIALTLSIVVVFSIATSEAAKALYADLVLQSQIKDSLVGDYRPSGAQVLHRYSNTSVEPYTTSGYAFIDKLARKDGYSSWNDYIHRRPMNKMGVEEESTKVKSNKMLVELPALYLSVNDYSPDYEEYSSIQDIKPIVSDPPPSSSYHNLYVGSPSRSSCVSCAVRQCNTVSVPEPSAILLLGIGLLVLYFTRCKKIYA